MATYKDLQDRIQLDYLNRYDLTGSVKRAIKNTIKCYEGTRWWFNETATTSVMTANSGSYGVPSDFLVLDRLEVAYSGARFPLKVATLDEVRTMNATTATSVPTHYVYRGDRFELALVPDSAYSATVYYIQSLPELSADADTNVWTNEAANLIAHGATVELLSSVVDADDRKIAHHVRMMRQALDEMYVRNDTRLHGSLQPTSF